MSIHHLSGHTCLITDIYHEEVLDHVGCFFFQFVYMMDNIDRFLYIEPSLHLWDEANLVSVGDFLTCPLIWFANILLNIFTSMFMSEIDL